MVDVSNAFDHCMLKGVDDLHAIAA